MRFFFTSIFIFSLILSSGLVLADFDIGKWQYEKEITSLSPITQPAYSQLTFDTEVFTHANRNLNDIRVIDNSGQEVPYKLLIEEAYTSREFYPAQILNKSYVPGEYQFFIVDLGRDGIFHNQIKILTSSANFRREAQIEGSNNQKQWFVLQEKGKIYDYSPPQFEFKKQDTTLNYPESTYRYLRVTIFSRGENPIDIQKAEVYRTISSGARRVQYPVQIVEQGENKEKRINYVVFDLENKGLPINSLQISTSDTNFSREVALEGSNDRIDWKIIEFRDALFSFSTPKFTGSKLSIDFSESNYRYLKLTIFNRDNPPIAITGANASGLLRKILFEYDPAKIYKLYYGNTQARLPEYDLEKFFPYLDIENPPQLTLGPEKENPSFEKPVSPAIPFSERYPWFLPAILVILVLILVGLVAKLILSAKHSARS